MATAFDDVKPWPKAPPAAGSQPGHNRPPLDVEARATFDDALRNHDGFLERVDTLLGAADRATATDEETAGRCGELVKQIRAATKVVEDAHKTAKDPYLAAGRAVDVAKNEIVGALETAKKKVEGKQTQFLREEEAKRQAEFRRQREVEEARRREEIEAEISAAKANGQNIIDVNAIPNPVAPVSASEPERQIIRGDYGASVSGQKVWLSHVDDYAAAFATVATNEKVREAIDKAVAGMVRAGVREISGVRIWSDVKASNR